MRFFDSAEVKVLMSAMAALEPLFEVNLAFDIIRKRAEQAIRANPDAMRKALIEDNRSAKEICLTTLHNLVRQDLVSGDNHLIGNRMTLIGDHKLGVFRIILLELVAIGVLSGDDLRVNETELQRELSDRFE